MMIERARRYDFSHRHRCSGNHHIQVPLRSHFHWGYPKVDPSCCFRVRLSMDLKHLVAG